MSLRFLINSPTILTTAGIAIAASVPFLTPAVSSGGMVSLGVLQAINVAAYAVNLRVVSEPGRIDSQQDDTMRKGNLNPERKTTTYTDVYSPARGRTAVSPAGWAFAIWGPIYLGEAAFLAGQFFVEPIQAIVPQVAVPFVAANLLQSLWCLSFRPEYNDGYKKYISVAMLGGTALALSQVHAVVTPALALYMLPMTLHFGWTSAATLVNLNGSFAMDEANSDSNVIALGHASALVATGLGVGVTLLTGAPAYGLTLAWALAACGDGVKARQEKNPLLTGMNVQRVLCFTGSALCAIASVVAYLR